MVEGTGKGLRKKPGEPLHTHTHTHTHTHRGVTTRGSWFNFSGLNSSEIAVSHEILAHVRIHEVS